MHRVPLLILALALFIGVVGLEWASRLEYSLGVLYVFPVLVAAMVMNRVEVVMAAVLSAWVRSRFTSGLPDIEFWLRFAMAVLAYAGIGLLVVEISRYRRAMAAAFGRLKLEQTRRQKAEEQLRDLAESSPAALLTLSANAEVLMANRAAHELLGFEPPSTLIGVDISAHVPVFAGALRISQGTPMLRTSTTGWASRLDGARFPVAMWFSTYGKGDDRKLAGILVDTSEEVRDRERETFRQVSDANRLFASAVSHEIRNLCSAIRVVSSNLLRASQESTPDAEALGALVESLSRISSFELGRHKGVTSSPLNVAAVLGQLRLVIEPDWSDLGGEVRVSVADNLPAVEGDAHSLLQVLLNLSQNSLRAVQGSEGQPVLKLSAKPDSAGVCISVEDSGGGIADTATLFQPFREGSAGNGLGLFISRALVRSFGGELTHIATPTGCRFDVTLNLEEAAS